MFSKNGRISRQPGSPPVRMLSFQLVLLTGLLIQWPAPLPGAQTPTDDFRSQFRDRLEALAQQFDSDGKPDLAKQVRESIPDRDPNRQYIFLPPTGTPAKDASATERGLIEKEFAQGLFERAKMAAADEQGAAAYQLLNETLVYDPHHEQARAILGFRNREGLGWVRTAKKTKARKATSRQKIVGWDRGSYWEIESPHFVIYSAAGEQPGLELAELLEQTWQIWRQVFFDYWCSERILNQWIAGDGSESAGSRKYKVVLFRDRQQYLSDLAVVPNIERSTGYYDEKKRASFFYAGDGASQATWRHEIVHQLLQENAGPYKSVGARGHAWLVEGIAMYFESTVDQGHYVTLGGFDANRLQYARLRSKREGFFEPMQSLDAMGREELQNHPDVARLYTQSSGVSQFLMTGEDGKYRDGFIQFVKDLYKRSRVSESLEERTLPLDQLDRYYMESLQVRPDDLESHWLNRNPEAFALGRAGLENRHVQLLANCTGLRWLELSENPKVGDDAVESLSSLTNLSQLFLDVTLITDASAPKLAKMTGLQELDLASTRFSDRGIAEIATLDAMQVLWLANTQITDDCIDDLARMPNLKIVDLRQTKVSAQGVQRLKSANPNLEIFH